MPQFVQSEQQRELISSLVQELPAYRKKMRMSQAELGDAVGKSRQRWSAALLPSVGTPIWLSSWSWALMAFWSRVAVMPSVLPLPVASSVVASASDF